MFLFPNLNNCGVNQLRHGADSMMFYDFRFFILNLIISRDYFRFIIFIVFELGIISDCLG
jgi:hypothetical protein